MNGFHQLFDIAFEFIRSGNFNTVLVAVVKQDSFVKLDDVALKRRAELAVHLLRKLRLLFDLLKVWEELAERKIFAGLDTPTKRGERIGIPDHENLALVGLAWVH